MVNFIRQKAKIFLFIAILAILTYVYHINSQHLNYLLNRGVVLEYSIDKNSIVDEEKLKDKLVDFGIYYIGIAQDEVGYPKYDFDEQKVQKNLYVNLAILPRQDKAEILNKISRYIFDNYKNSKLTDVKTFNDNYNEPWAGFFKFFEIMLLTTFIWLIILYLFCDRKKLNSEFKKRLGDYKNSLKENTKNLYTKTKEKGFGYLISRILFDDPENNGMAREVVTTIVFVFVCVIVIRYFIGELRWIPSSSMYPVILIKDRVFVEKLDFPIKKEIKRGDILVFYPPETNLLNTPLATLSRLTGINMPYDMQLRLEHSTGMKISQHLGDTTAYIKRVVGLPGEKFEIKYNPDIKEFRVYINDKPLNEPYISSKAIWSPCTNDMYCGPMIIPENNYFMMGDNRNCSKDSRYWGVLDKNRIIGRASFMFWPLDRINLMKDKYIELDKQKTKDGYEKNNYIVNRYEFLYKI
ncbi:signal peptidase I [bacterium]|nr:signal peptidase I [bacterium]